MKAIRRSPVTRFVVWLLTMAMIMPVLGVAPSAAGAQQAPSLDVIVADFTNNSGYGGTQLAQAATDAVAVELSNSGRYTVSQPQEVLSAAKELGLRVPTQPGQRPNFTKQELLKIAKQLGAGGIVQGTLDQARASKGGGVSIGLSMTVMETASGELINGGAAFGRARPRPGEEDQASLFNEAVSNAATDVVRQAVQRQIPMATVLNINGQGGATDSMVILNRGLRDGVKVGDEMIILRNGVQEGRVRVARAYATDSEADVLENKGGIQPQDDAQVLYTPPVMTALQGFVENPGGRHVSFSGIGTALAAIGLGVLIVSAAKGGQGTVTSLTAEPTSTDGLTAAVRVGWGDNIFGQAGVLEYHVYRNPGFPYVRTFTSNTNGNTGSTTGGTTGTTGTTTTISAAVPIGITSDTEHTFTDLPVGARLFWNGGLDFQVGGIPVLGGTVIGGGNSTGGGNGGGNTGGNTGTGSSCAAFVPAPTDTGFTPGTTYTYQVLAIIARLTVTPSAGGGGGTGTTTGGIGGGTTGGIGGGTTGGIGGGTTGTGTTTGGNTGGNTGNNGGVDCIETDPAVSGQATPITPATLLTPAAQATTVNITAFAPTWTSRIGADVFQVEVSTDNTFKNANRIFHIGPIFSTAPLADGVTQTLTTPVDLTAQSALQADPTFLNFVENGGTPPRIYWRVGARHDSDSPGPVNFITLQGNSTDRTFRWVYDAAQPFFPAPTPPTAPGKAANRLNTLRGDRAQALPLPLPGQSATGSVFKPQTAGAIVSIQALRHGPQSHK